MTVIYLDNNATTKVAPEVVDAMLPYLSEQYGNPSSMHSFGGDVAAKIEQSRENIAKLIGASPNEIVFTSCGTESNGTAIRATIAEEKQWLADISGEGLATNYELKSEEARTRCEGFIKYLEYLADTLAAGRPVTQPPPGPPKDSQEPQYDDKAPDLDELDLDSLLD